MALIFRDTFTEGADTTLASHTPTTGTSWTKLINGGGGDNLQVTAATDICASDGTGGLGDGSAYTADATYSTANYEVSCKLAGALAADDPVFLMGRIADASNFYTALFLLNAGVCRIYKMVAGTPTALGTGFTFDSDSPPAVGDRLSFVLNGTTLEMRLNGVLLDSTTDSDLSAAGKAGLGMGNIGIDSGHDIAAQAADDFAVHSIVAGGSNETLRPNAAGDSNQLEHKDGTAGDTNNYTEVDEAVADDDTTYVRMGNLGVQPALDLYNLPATGIGGSDTIRKVTVTSRVAKGAAWGAIDSISPALKIDSLEFRGAEKGPAATTYEDMTQVFWHNPADGTAWDTTDINNLQIGVSVVSESGAPLDDELRCTQVFATINYDAAAPVGGGAVSPGNLALLGVG